MVWYSADATMSSGYEISEMQSDEEARVIETAVREAVLSVMEVINSISRIRLLDYQRKVAEKDKENALLKAEVVRAEKELSFQRQLVALQQEEGVKAANTVAQVQEAELNVETCCGKRGTEMNEAVIVQSSVKQSKSHSTEVHFECLSLETTATIRGDVVTGSSAEVCSPSEYLGSHMDFVTGINFPVVKEEPPNTDTVYIKFEVKEENKSTHLDSSPSCALETETLENSSFTHHPPEVQSDTRGRYSCSSARWGDGRLSSVSSLKKRYNSRQRSRLYRERIRADPERHQVYLERERRRYQQRREKSEAARSNRARKKCHLAQLTEPI